MHTSEFRYRAFISYSHRDEGWASWLHKALERYRLPRRLVGRVTPTGAVPARIAPVFRDREELPTATDLSRVVTAALEQSAAMIVICSPTAAASRWVNEEIKTFQRLGRQEHIFCLIVGGAPEALDEEQCFPPALRGVTAGGMAAAEAIGADVRPGKDRQRTALLKLVAGLVGVGLDELVRRDMQRRNRRMAAVTAAALAGMAVTSVLATLALLARSEAQEQRARAETEAATAQQTSEFLVQLFEVVDPGEARGNTITAREILDRGALRIDRELAEQPVVRANLLRTMGRVYTGLGLYEPATQLLERAVTIRRALDDAPTAESVGAANELGEALYLKGEYAEAEGVYAEALRRARELYPRGDAAVTFAMNGLADVATQNGDFEVAEDHYTAALAMDRELHGDDHEDVARTLGNLANMLLYQERFDESAAAMREALEIRRRVLGSDHPMVAETLNNLGGLLYFSGRAAEAEPYVREAVTLNRQILGDEHPTLASNLNNLARLLLERAELGEAAELLEEGLAIDRKLKDRDHDDFVFPLNNLGLARLAQGDAAAALPLLEEALRVATIHEHRMTGQVLSNLADGYGRFARYEDAHAAIEAARPLLEAEFPDEPWYLANLASIEGGVQVRERALEAAAPLLEESYGVLEQRWERSGLFTRMAAGRLADLYDARGDAVKARDYRERAAGR